VSHGPGELWTTGIKKCLAVLVMQLGSRIFKVHSCVTEAHADVQVTAVHPYNAVSA
jgi:exo-beta-1,3-glucanase (GH17 family)